MCEHQLRELGFKSLERGGPREFQRAKRELVFIGLFYLVKVFVFATNGMFLPIFFSFLYWKDLREVEIFYPLEIHKALIDVLRTRPCFMHGS